MRHKNIKITILCDCPKEEPYIIAGFICDALQSYGGGGDPNDPLFNSMSIKKVTIEGVDYSNTNPKDIEY